MKLEPYSILFMADNCFLVKFELNTSEENALKAGKQITERNHSVEFEIMVKRQDSISNVIESAKKILRQEILPHIAV